MPALTFLHPLPTPIVTIEKMMKKAYYCSLLLSTKLLKNLLSLIFRLALLRIIPFDEFDDEFGCFLAYYCTACYDY